MPSVIKGLSCPGHVPGDPWGTKDLEELYADLLPIEEPVWDDQTLYRP